MNTESQYRLLRAATRLAALPSLGAARAAGRGLARLGWRLDRKHREIVRDNLAQSFPERDAAWVEATARACFDHLGMLIGELPRLVHLRRAEVMARTRFHGLDVYQRHLAKGKGVILLTGHIGNWEWASLAASLTPGIQACLVARPLDWPAADRLVRQWRTQTGHETVPKAHSARTLLKYLRRGQPIALLLDQNVDWYDGVFVEFFGRTCCTNKGAALLAQKTGAPVVPFYSFRAPDGGYDVYFEDEAPLVNTGSKVHDTWANTQNYTARWEAVIRQRPEQWFWMHQRWKTKDRCAWPREPKA